MEEFPLEDDAQESIRSEAVAAPVLTIKTEPEESWLTDGDSRTLNPDQAANLPDSPAVTSVIMNQSDSEEMGVGKHGIEEVFL